MSRAARVWAALSQERRGLIADFLHEMFNEDLADALDADAAEQQRLQAALTAPPFDAFQTPLFAEAAAGPRLTPRAGNCLCGREVTTELTAWVADDKTVLWLGPKCWRERSLRRAQAAAGEQLQIGET